MGESDPRELARERLRALRRGLGPHLAAAFDELSDRLELDRAPGEAGYFSAPLTLPVLQLPLWVARAAARRGRPIPTAAVEDLVESAAVGYLHVRVQDDLLDEGLGRPAQAMLLAEALLVRHGALIARAVGASERFWAYYEQRWREYGEAMLLEHRLLATRSGYDRAAFDAVLRRSQPLAIPGAAALERAGLTEDLSHLETYVRHLVRAHQLFHDLIDAEKDLAGGNHTHLLQRFGGAEGREALRRRLYLEGGFDAITEEALADLDRAKAAADRAGLPEAVEAAEGRQRLMDRLRRETFATLFQQILASQPKIA